MSEQETKTDRWYFDVTIHDEKTGARRSANSYVVDGADPADELLNVLMSAATSADLGTAVVRRMEQTVGGDIVFDMRCGADHGAAANLERITALLDRFDWMNGATPLARVDALVRLTGRTPREEQPDGERAEPEPAPAEEPEPVAAEGPEDGELPRSLAEPEGEDPADEAPETFRGRPVRDVDLPVEREASPTGG